MAAVDIDQDGAMDLLAADGWHFKYGTHARARLALYRGPDFKDRRILADFPDEYTLNRIEVIPSSKEGTPRILVTGTQSVHLLHLDGVGWQSKTMGPTSETDRAIVWSDKTHHYAVIPGSPASVVRIDD